MAPGTMWILPLNDLWAHSLLMIYRVRYLYSFESLTKYLDSLDGVPGFEKSSLKSTYQPGPEITLCYD